MHTLVTGGAGFVARHLGPALARAGHRLVNLDLVAPDPASAYVRSVRGDVRDPAAVRAAIAGCECVVHLAAAHHDFGIETATYFDVNERGMHALCEAMTAEGVRRIVFFSSVAVYGDAGPEPDEASAPQPWTPYGRSKLAAERVLERWSREAPGRRAIVLRPAAIFGAHHFANVYALVRQIESGLYLQVGDGTNRKSLAYVPNVVDGVLHLLARDARAPFEVYNYVDKPDLTSSELARIVCAALGRPAPRMRVPLPLALAMAAPIDALAAVTRRDLRVSRTRIRKLAEAETRFAAAAIRATGFEPRHTLEDGLRDMVRWYRSEGRGLTPVAHRPPAHVACFDRGPAAARAATADR